MTDVIVSSEDVIVQVPQPTVPTSAPPPKVGLVEINQVVQRGSAWMTGHGPPTAAGGQPGDMYLDMDTGDVYLWNGTSWDFQGTFAPSTDTPEEVLAKMVTVDGAGSGLDADLLDGQHGAYYAVAADLAAEVTARTNADTNLQTQITTNANNVAAETTARQNADTTLTNNLAAEVTARTNADTTLTNNLSAETTARQNADALLAPLNSPPLTGNPTAPTPSPGDNDTSIATTAFVTAAVSAATSGLPAQFVEVAGDTMTGKLNTMPSTAGGVGLGLGVGVAPSAPVDGDLWATNANLVYRINGVNYNVCNLGGSQTISGAKTFSIKPIMTTPAAGTASINLPHGTAPTAPANGDLWTTTAGLFVRANAVTFGPLIGEAPNDGTQYVRKNLAWTAVSVPPGTIISDTIPSGVTAGQFWWESDTGNLYIYYDDGNTQQWVQVNVTGTAPGTARRGNRASNGAMLVAQETTGTVGTNGAYALDQWAITMVGLSLQAALAVLSPASPYGTPNSIGFSYSVQKASLAAGDFGAVYQPVEGIRVADFQWGTAQAIPVVVRFNAKAEVPGLYSLMIRNPATTYSFVKGLNLTTSMQTFTIPIPAQVNGVWPKDNTLGFHVFLTSACGTTLTAPAEGWNAGNYVAAPGQINLAASPINKSVWMTDFGIYADPDNTGVAPPWEFPNATTELLDCQRYYYKNPQIMNGGYNVAGAGGYYSINHRVPMRTAPSLTYGVSSSSNISTGDIRNATSESMLFFCVPAATGGYAMNISYALNARM